MSIGRHLSVSPGLPRAPGPASRTRRRARGYGRRVASEYAKALGGRLRSVRTQQGLSLQGVQDRSHGRLKAVVVGSYERGDRAVTVERLAELARFYGVAVAALLPDGGGAPGAAPDSSYVLDLKAVGAQEGEKAEPLARFVAALRSQRGQDAEGLVPVTDDDLLALAAVYQLSTEELVRRLRGWGVLLDAPAH
jgi:transcriptional regulator with XRE-family HTH domain